MGSACSTHFLPHLAKGPHPSKYGCPVTRHINLADIKTTPSMSFALGVEGLKVD